MGRRASRLLGWIAVFVWAGAIFAVSATPGSRLPGGNPILAHTVEYALLGILLFLALRVDMGHRAAAVSAILIASVYGVTDEIHQAFVPLRTPDVFDWVVDTLGATAGLLLFLGADRLLRRGRD